MGMSVRAVRFVRLVGYGLTARWQGGQDASKHERGNTLISTWGWRGCRGRYQLYRRFYHSQTRQEYQRLENPRHNSARKKRR